MYKYILIFPIRMVLPLLLLSQALCREPVTFLK